MKLNRIALVTGGSKGIGAAIAVALAEDGYDIWLNYRSDHDGAQKVASEVEAFGVECRLLPFDVADPEAVKDALGSLLEEHKLDVLVNNAGFTRDTLMFWMDFKDWRDVMGVHLDGFFLVTQMALTGMLSKRRGRVVNIVSTSGQTGMAGQTNYSAAKAGVIGATRALAREVAKRNILVNAVAPGFIKTEMTAELPEKDILPMIPQGRMGDAEEVAHMVSFLCSDKASYVTGQVFSVNGGAYM